MNYPVKHCAAIILAAGKSQRMGSPKQLLRYNNKTFLEHVADEATASEAERVIIVLGYAAGEIVAATNITGAHVLNNENWERGMASSIITGIKYLIHEHPDTDAAILLVSDQPYLDSALLNKMLAKQRETGLPIVACEYERGAGVPALFHKFFFSQLLALKGDAGAKRLINQNLNLVATVPFPLGHVDVDTPEAYQKLC